MVILISGCVNRDINKLKREDFIGKYFSINKPVKELIELRNDSSYTYVQLTKQGKFIIRSGKWKGPIVDHFSGFIQKEIFFYDFPYGINPNKRGFVSYEDQELLDSNATGKYSIMIDIILYHWETTIILDRNPDEFEYIFIKQE